LYSDPQLLNRARVNMLLSASIVVLATIVWRTMRGSSVLGAESVGLVAVIAVLVGFAFVRLNGMRHKSSGRVVRQAALMSVIGGGCLAGGGVLLWALQGAPPSLTIVIMVCGVVMAASGAAQWRSLRRVRLTDAARPRN
jgi:hypothetical protein